MDAVSSESYRGFGVLMGLMLDRLLVPVAILVALVGAAIIGLQLSQMLGIHGEYFYRI